MLNAIAAFVENGTTVDINTDTRGDKEGGGVGGFSKDQIDTGKDGDKESDSRSDSGKEKEKVNARRPQAAPTDNHKTTRQQQPQHSESKNNFTTSYTTTVHPSKPDQDPSPQYYPTVTDAMVSLLYAFQEQTFLLSNTTFGPLHEAVVGDS